MVKFLRAALGPLFAMLCFGFVELAHAGPNLQSSRITREYREILEVALRAFGVWLAARSLPNITALVSTPHSLSTHLVAGLELQFDNGSALTAGRNKILGLQTVCRQLSGSLILASDSVRLWEQT